MLKYIKIVGFAVIISALISSCATTKVQLEDAGNMTLASTKNVKLNGEYVLLSRSAGFDESQAKAMSSKGTKRSTRNKILSNYEKLKADNVEKAINNVVENVPGGIYMENMELYYTKSIGGKDIFFVASGDVYGLSGAEKNIRGFIVGTKAFYKRDSGTVITLIDDQKCLWKSDKNNKSYEVLYDDLTKIGE